MVKFSKSYQTSEDYAYRLKIFSQQMQKIVDHNSKSEVTWQMAVNQFADMTSEEMRAKHTGLGAGIDRPLMGL